MTRRPHPRLGAHPMSASDTKLVEREYARLRERCDGFWEPDERCPRTDDCRCYAVRLAVEGAPPVSVSEPPTLLLRILARAQSAFKYEVKS